MERTRIFRTIEFGSPRSNIHLARITRCFTLDIKKYIRRCLNGQILEPFEERIIFMSMFNDIEWTKKGDTETCSYNAKEVAAFGTQFKPENTWWNGNSNAR